MPASAPRSAPIADAKTSTLADDDLDVLRYDEWLAGLEAGFAAHHAGMVPPMKEAVEEAFAAGLVKVVFATETLSLGINMPARSVVIEKLSKFTGERHEFLTPGEYTQLTGRAGRRGIDDRGYAIVCWSPFVPFDQVASLASRRTDALTSSFRPTYNMAANLVRRYTKFEAHHLLNLSFAQFHADRDVVALERQLERSRQLLARQRELVGPDLETCRSTARSSPSSTRSRATAPRAAVASPRPSRRCAPATSSSCAGAAGVSWCSATSTGAAGAVAWSRSRPGVTSCGSARTTSTRRPRRAATIDLPTPFAPRNPTFRRTAAERLRRAKLHDDGGRSRREERRQAQLERPSPTTRSAGTPSARPSCARDRPSSASSAT